MGYASPSRMLREMTGEELQDWRVYFLKKDEERRDSELDRRGRARLRAMK